MSYLKNVNLSSTYIIFVDKMGNFGFYCIDLIIDIMFIERSIQEM